MSRGITDLNGLSFGMLVVLAFAEVRNGKAYWRCLCSCGQETSVRADALKSGSIRSCGCQRNVRQPIADRFWPKVERRDRDDCWPWLAYIDKEGYGRFRTDQRWAPAHRIAFELHHGSIDETLDVLHTCDNPPCCNPAHLVQGTHQQNMKDKLARDRLGKVAKLSREDVKSIRERAAQGETQRSIAADFDVHQSTISNAINHTWRHV